MAWCLRNKHRDNFTFMQFTKLFRDSMLSSEMSVCIKHWKLSSLFWPPNRPNLHIRKWSMIPYETVRRIRKAFDVI